MVQIRDIGVGSEKVSESPAHQNEGKEERGRALDVGVTSAEILYQKPDPLFFLDLSFRSSDHLY